MVDVINSEHKETELNAALELMHFGFRAIIAEPDERLAALGYSRVHHRVLYFVGRHPQSTVTALCEVMRVSKQYLNRPLRQLIDDGYVVARKDDQDQRVKRLELTEKGVALEKSLTGEQRRQLAAVFTEAGSEAEHGWRKVMALLSKRRS